MSRRKLPVLATCHFITILLGEEVLEMTEARNFGGHSKGRQAGTINLF